MPGSVLIPEVVAVLPKALCSAFSMTTEFALISSGYKSGEYQNSLLVDNERRKWKQQRRLTPLLSDALVAFYLARGGSAQAFWFYDPFEVSPTGDIGSNWDATGLSTAGRYAVRFDSPMTQAMGGPGRLVHDFVLREVYGTSALVSAILHVVTAEDQTVVMPGYQVSLVSANGNDSLSDFIFDLSTLNDRNWAKKTNSADISTPPAGVGSEDKSYMPGFTLEIFIRWGAGDPDGPTDLFVYGASIDLTFADGSTATIVPHVARATYGPTGGSLPTATDYITDEVNAVDGDDSTFATLHMEHSDMRLTLSAWS